MPSSQALLHNAFESPPQTDARQSTKGKRVATAVVVLVLVLAIGIALASWIPPATQNNSTSQNSTTSSSLPSTAISTQNPTGSNSLQGMITRVVITDNVTSYLTSDYTRINWTETNEVALNLSYVPGNTIDIYLDKPLQGTAVFEVTAIRVLTPGFALMSTAPSPLVFRGSQTTYFHLYLLSPKASYSGEVDVVLDEVGTEFG